MLGEYVNVFNTCFYARFVLYIFHVLRMIQIEFALNIRVPYYHHFTYVLNYLLLYTHPIRENTRKLARSNNQLYHEFYMLNLPYTEFAFFRYQV